MKGKDFIKVVVTCIAISLTVVFNQSCKKTAATGPQGPTADFTVDMNTTADTSLLRIGGALVTNGIIIVNDNNNYAALYDNCSYGTCALAYNTVSPHLTCPCHGCQFALDGSLMVGPATVPIKVYKVTKSGNILHVTG